MKRVTILCVVMLIVFGVSLMAQDYTFRKGSFYIGPRIGLASVGNAGFGYALNGEYGVEGPIGIFGSVGYASYSEAAGGFSFDFTNILLSAGGNFHIDILKVERLDTYIGINLGYAISSVSNAAGASYTGATASVFRWGAQVGGRYHISPSVALAAEGGWGVQGIIRLGFDIAF